MIVLFLITVISIVIIYTSFLMGMYNSIIDNRKIK
jgi:hypothetical protein